MTYLQQLLEQGLNNCLGPFKCHCSLSQEGFQFFSDNDGTLLGLLSEEELRGLLRDEDGGLVGAMEAGDKLYRKLIGATGV